MTVRYLLPCHGDQAVEVTIAHAGHTVVCPCGKSVVVPTLREIKRLPVAPAGNEPRPLGAAWSLQQGILFSLGVLLVAASAVALGVIGYKRSRLSTEAVVIPAELHEQLRADTSGMEPARTLALWRALRDTPLPDRSNYVMKFELDRKTSAVLRRRMMLAGGVGVLGACLALAGLLYKPRPPRPRGKRPAKAG